jgi:hypothetical protein
MAVRSGVAFAQPENRPEGNAFQHLTTELVVRDAAAGLARLREVWQRAPGDALEA